MKFRLDNNPITTENKCVNIYIDDYGNIYARRETKSQPISRKTLLRKLKKARY